MQSYYKELPKILIRDDSIATHFADDSGVDLEIINDTNDMDHRDHDQALAQALDQNQHQENQEGPGEFLLLFRITQ